MINSISFGSSPWYILLCILVGLVGSAILYYQDKKFDDAPAWSRWLMPILRFLGLTAVALLLLAPVFKTLDEETKKPIVVIAEDNSQSIVNGLEAPEITAQKNAINTLADGLGEAYDVRRITFGDELRESAVDSFISPVSNISSAIEYVDDNYGDQNLGALVMVTDGIYNEGKNPLYLQGNMTAPIYSVALGDTTQRRDLWINNVFHNKIAYLNDKFTIQVDVSAFNLAGRSSRLTVEKVVSGNTSTAHTEVLNINDNDYFDTREIILPADVVGINQYRISVSPVQEELTTANNYKDIYVEVLDARQKILLYADGPHPDLGALKTIITGNENYEVDILFAGDNVELNDYDLVVFHNLPSGKNKINNILEQMDRRDISRLFIVGATVDMASLNTAQNLLSIRGNTSVLEDIQATFEPNFTAFTLSIETKNSVSRFPPLSAPFGEYEAGMNAQVLFNQRIKKIDTEAPLLLFQASSSANTGVWVGEGIWRWRLFNHLEYGNIERVSEIVNKTIQFVTTKEDKRKFRVNIAENVYQENDDVIFDAQLYNDNYELINGPESKLTISGPDGEQYNFVFNKTSNYYTLNARRFPPGNYAYSAEVSFNGEQLTDGGRFSVQDIQVELYDLTARHGLLYSLSEGSGGVTTSVNDIDRIKDHIMNNGNIKPVVYSSTRSMSILHYKWLFFTILLFLAAEWFLRRYMGRY